MNAALCLVAMAGHVWMLRAVTAVPVPPHFQEPCAKLISMNAHPSPVETEAVVWTVRVRLVAFVRVGFRARFVKPISMNAILFLVETGVRA
jgi:hypothetical protein